MAVRLPEGEKSGETTGQYLWCPLRPRGRECCRRPRVCGCLGPASVLPGRGVISNTRRGCNPDHSPQEHPKPGEAAPATSLAAPSLQAPRGALGSRPHHTWPLFVQSPRWGGGDRWQTVPSGKWVLRESCSAPRLLRQGEPLSGAEGGRLLRGGHPSPDPSSSDEKNWD